MGISGCGKSTLAQALASRLDWPLLEADDVHSDANRTRMAAGHPLTDAMRPRVFGGDARFSAAASPAAWPPPRTRNSR